MNLTRDVSMAMSANSNSTSDWIRDHKCLYVDLSTIPVHSACTDRMLYDIQAIAFYVIILSFIAIPIKSIFLYKRLRTPMKSQVSHRIQCFFGLFALAYDVGYFIHGMLKLFGPSEYVIGRANGSVGIDIVFLLTSSANVCLLHCVALHLSQFLLGTLRIVPAQFRDKIVRIIRRVDTTAVLAPVFGVVLSALPFLCYAAPSYSALFNALYLLGYWMVMVYQSLLNFFLALYTEREMRRVLDNNINSHLKRADNSVDNSVSSIPSAYSSNHDAKLHAAITQLRRTRIFATGKSVLTCSTWIAYTLVPSLRIYFTCYYMLFYMVSYFTSMLLVRSLWNFGSGSTSKPSTVVPVIPQMLQSNGSLDNSSEGKHFNSSPTKCHPNSPARSNWSAEGDHVVKVYIPSLRYYSRDAQRGLDVSSDYESA
jgi:hypothetical protein